MASRAEIVAVGSELLTPTRVDTNSLHITARLNEIGITVGAKAVVADDRARIAAALRDALARADVVIVTGGLGPTDDDLTREAAADVFALPLEEDPAITARIRQRFERRGLSMPENNRRQSMVPRGAEVIENARGTAPGLWLVDGHRRLLLLPGPPGEMQPMLDAWCERHGRALGAGTRIARRVLKIANRPESHVEEIAQPVYSRWAQAELPIATTILAAAAQIELHLSVAAASDEEARARLDPAVAELARALGPSVFTTEDESLEEVVGRLLREHGKTIALGESCTGGLLASRLTDVPGSSDYVIGGVVAYSNRLKIELLGVPAALIEEHGAVSEPVAVAMADGARSRHDASIGVGITGIAGPSGGTTQKPVGTVAIAVSTADGPLQVRTYHFLGGRRQIKYSATQAALDQVRRLLLPREP
ncbi:MAG TPA: competence/damage-inducible protein A [Vicinamibacterales bacterium]|nr:competence/damage-inducible protein A [Vicinamibacterales bacterium]